jgi:hypothetical protein
MDEFEPGCLGLIGLVLVLVLVAAALVATA